MNMKYEELLLKMRPQGLDIELDGWFYDSQVGPDILLLMMKNVIVGSALIRIGFSAVSFRSDEE